MDRFVNRQSIERYRKLANETTSATEWLQVMKLLADAEAKLKAQFGGSASMADMSSKIKDGLSGVQDKLNSMLHKNP